MYCQAWAVYQKLHRASCALFITALAVMQPSSLWAAERSALIQYIFLLPQAGSGSLCRASSNQSIKPVHADELPAMFAGPVGGSNLSIFQEIDKSCSFILLIELMSQSFKRPDGFQKSLTIPKDFDYSQAFGLTSSFVTGSTQLGATKGSLVTFQHVDVGPDLTGQMPDAFNSLYRRLSILKGLQGFQVWVWTLRPNHWTVITSWEDQDSASAAQFDPEVMKIWDALYRNTAAPRHQEFYRLVETNQTKDSRVLRSAGY